MGTLGVGWNRLFHRLEIDIHNANRKSPIMKKSSPDSGAACIKIVSSPRSESGKILDIYVVVLRLGTLDQCSPVGSTAFIP